MWEIASQVNEACGLLICLFAELLSLSGEMPAKPGNPGNESKGTCGSSSAPAQTEIAPALHVDAGHPWRPPFRLERVGKPMRIVVNPPAAYKAGEESFLIGYCEGRALSRERLTITDQSPIIREMSPSIDRVALIAGNGETWREIASMTLERDRLEADAEACPEIPANPIDLGAVFPPADWLLLTPGQRAQVRIAVFCTSIDAPDTRVIAWFDAQPQRRVEAPLRLNRGERSEVAMELPELSFRVPHDTLQVSIQDRDGTELWRKPINVMLVRQPPVWPRFGATETKLRYDSPISIRDPKTETLSTLPYEQGWAQQLQDIVVSLPNGSRFVFWRGSSYVPFWAGRRNTGLSYEWAETGPLPEGFVDSVEPLMDKELRYGRVCIVESTSARVHVRWTYQSCDFNYKVWGDAAQEDFYFYPDGFGSRVLTINSAPDADYEISEFIVLAPPEGYPFDLLPPNPIRSLALDGTTATVPIPFVTEKIPAGLAPPTVYRVQFGKEESETAVYFNPCDPFKVEELVTFRPFYDRGYMVTPAYWGSHWPLARGKTTGGAIDDRIHVSPSHNSLMSWARHRPEPVWSRCGPSLDTLGRSRQMLTQRWVWLIGVTAEPDAMLIARARSFAEPASLEVSGADIGIKSYISERRAYRLNVRANPVVITIKPNVRCVNPVFELMNAPKDLVRVELGDRRLRNDEYAWDGQTLWLGVDIDVPVQLLLEFRK